MKRLEAKPRARTSARTKQTTPTPKPKSKTQLVEEIERLNRTIAQREGLLVVGAMLFGAALWEACKPKEADPSAAIVKVKP